MTSTAMNHRRADHVGVLHNSGPSPMSVYKTAAVGSVWRVLPQVLIRDLLRHHGIEGGHPFCELTITEPILHPRIIDIAVCAAVVQLEESGVRVERPSNAVSAARELIARDAPTFRDKGRSLGPRTRAGTDRAVRRLLTLRSILDSCGALPPFVGITEWAANPGTTQPRPYPWLPAHSDASGDPHALSMAWALLALAHYARPVLLFRRMPTFDGFRSTGALLLRWFGNMPVASTELS